MTCRLIVGTARESTNACGSVTFRGALPVLRSRRRYGAREGSTHVDEDYKTLNEGLKKDSLCQSTRHPYPNGAYSNRGVHGRRKN